MPKIRADKLSPQTLVIIGAGAIGRGFLPWIFRDYPYDLIFVDSNTQLIERMREARRFTVYMVKGNDLESYEVRVSGAYTSVQFKVMEHPRVAAVFVNVGPRNCAVAARLLEGYQGPVILCENDPATVDTVKAESRLENVYFAIPDVISSNTAPAHLLKRDPLSVVTEDGVLYVDAQVSLQGNLQRCKPDELKKQWTAKLFLHNTAHCVAAYLGSIVGATYVHEAMAVPEVNAIVAGAMTEMLNALKVRSDIPHQFLDWYAAKELARFRSQLLFDPISRVAREPLRKLDVGGRLIGAAEICLSVGFMPQNILLGIASAILFNSEKDSDHHMSFMRRSVPPNTFLTHVLNLRQGEALSMVLYDRLPNLIRQLGGLPRIRGKVPVA